MRTRDIKKLEAAARYLKEATDDVFASVWYFQNKSDIKGSNWAYVACRKAEAALKILRKRFP